MLKKLLNTKKKRIAIFVTMVAVPIVVVIFARPLLELYVDSVCAPGAEPSELSAACTDAVSFGLSMIVAMLLPALALAISFFAGLVGLVITIFDL